MCDYCSFHRFLCSLFKTAFITILGHPNAGKSTLLNAILGDKLVITNKKAQTTRRRIKGIHNEPGYQLVFSDTPGILEKSAYLLQEHMMHAVTQSLEDADILIIVIDAASDDSWDELKKMCDTTELPVLVCLNKIDLVDQAQQLELISRASSFFATEHIVPLSALKAKKH